MADDATTRNSAEAPNRAPSCSATGRIPRGHHHCNHRNARVSLFFARYWDFDLPGTWSVSSEDLHAREILAGATGVD